MVENSEFPKVYAKSSLKSPAAFKRTPDSRRVTFSSLGASSPKQPRLLFGTLTPSPADFSRLSQPETPIPEPCPEPSIQVTKPVAADEIFHQVLMLQMKTVAMREQNWLKILEPLAKIKNGAARVAEEDQCIHHADTRLKDCLSKSETKAQKAKERIDEINAIQESIKPLREKFEALLSK